MNVRAKKDIHLDRELEHTFFEKGEKFVVLSQWRGEAVLRHAEGYLTFLYSVPDLVRDFDVIEGA